MMRRRIVAGVTAVLALVAGLVVVQPTGQATALSAGVDVSADDLATWQTNGVVRGLASSKGFVVAVGDFTEIRPPQGVSGSRRSAPGLAVFDAATGAPASCQFPLTGGTARAFAATTAPDGQTVFVGGNFGSIGGVSRSRVAEIDLGSCSVRPFQVAGISSFVYAIAPTADAVYLGGAFQSVAGQTRRGFAKVNRAGTLDPSWVSDALGNMLVRPEKGVECRVLPDANTQGRAVSVSPDGSRVALGGAFYTVNGANSHSLAIVDSSSGDLVRAYPSNPDVWGDSSNFIHPCSITKAITSDGTGFYIGNEGSGGGVFDGAASFSWATLDQRWRDTCLGAIQALAVDAGTLYRAHHHHDCSSTGQFPDGRRIYLSASRADDPMQAQIGWYPTLNDGTGEGIGGRALTVAHAGGVKQLWVGGEFTRVNGALQQGLTRFGPDDTGNPPTPTLALAAHAPGQVQVAIRTVYDPDDSPLSYVVYRNGIALGDPITAPSSWWTRPQVNLIDDTVRPGTSYSYRVRAIDAAGNQSNLSGTQSIVASATGSAYAAVIAEDRPDFFWRYDDAGTWVIDRGATAPVTKNGIASSTLAYGAGAIPEDASRSATLNGTSQFVWNDQITRSPSTYSIETWFKTTSTTGGVLVNFGNGRPRTDSGAHTWSSNYDRMVYMEPSGRLRFGVYDGAVRSLRSPAAYNDNQWHHVVATQGAGGMRLYVDGREVGRNGVTGAQSYFGTWRAGGDNLNNWPDNGGDGSPTRNVDVHRFYDGQLDETAVYPSVLSHERAIAHYRAGGGSVRVGEVPDDAYGAAVFGDNPTTYWRFDEQSGRVATDSSLIGQREGAIGADTARTRDGLRIPGGAVTTPGIDANGAGIVASDLTNAPTTYSLEFWVKTRTTRGGKIIGFENSPTGSGRSYDKQVYMLNDGRVRFGVYAGRTQTIASAAKLNDGAWHHVVATQDDSGMKLYVDGALSAQNAVTTSETGDGHWRVGGGNIASWPDRPSSDYFQGTVDEVAVYPAALPGARVQQHFVVSLNDTAPPSVPTGLAQVGTDTARLTWNASTDANGVSGYRVYRGATADFRTGADSLVADVARPGWTDPDEASGTRYYRVTAYDTTGNESAASTAVTARIVDRAAPSIPTALTAAAAGSDVQLEWTASTDNVGVDHYEIHRAATGQQALDPSTVIAETGSATYLESNVPEGRWYYRVVAVDAAGNKSVASAAAGVLVDVDTDAPSTPGGLAAAVAASGAVTLSWTASSDDVGVVGYRVYRADSAAAGADDDSLVADAITGTTWTDPDRASGTRYYRVVAYDLAGNDSAPTGAVAAVVRDATAPSVPTALEAEATGTDVALTWRASTDDSGAVEYVVHRGGAAGFAPTDRTAIGTTTTAAYTDAGAPTGEHYYRVVARDPSGNASEASAAVRVRITPPVVEPVEVVVPITEDAMVAQSVPNQSYGKSNQLSSRATAGTIESFLRLPLPAAPAGTTLTGATLSVRTSTDATAASAEAHRFDLVAGTWDEDAIRWGNRPTRATSPVLGALTGAMRLNTPYAATLDPAALASSLGSSVTLRMAGMGGDNLRLWSANAANASYRPSLTLTFSPTTGPADTTAPAAPGGLSAQSPDASTVSLSWRAATDDVGVTGYTVYRGSSADFVADASSRIAGVSALAHSDGGLAPGTYYYRVTARDSAGNVSAASPAVAATLAPPVVEPVEVVQTVVTTADTMVASNNASGVYGTSNQLSSRGAGAGTLASFLAFPLPAAPAGGTLTGATVSVRTSTDASATSADTHQLTLMGGAWDEATMTWNNRLTRTTSGVLGEFGPMPALNTPYRATLSPAELRPLAGQTITLRISSAGADNMRVWSREASNAAFRPTLTLTYSVTP